MTSRFLSDRAARWARWAGLVAVFALAWAVLVPSGLFWNTALAAGLVGAAIATLAVVRSRSRPSLAQVIATAQAEGAPVRIERGHP